MTRLRTVKNSHRLREFTDLRPLLRCKTRWSGAFNMVNRFFQIKDHIRAICDEDEILDDIYCSLKKQDVISLEDLLLKMKQLNSIMLKLQERNITLLVGRKLFDHALRHFPTMQTYLQIDSRIVHSPVFESALIKLLKKVIIIIIKIIKIIF